MSYGEGSAKVLQHQSKWKIWVKFVNSDNVNIQLSPLRTSHE